MRILEVVSCGLLVFAAARGGEVNEADPYAISVVQVALKMRSAGHKFILSQTQKHLARLGDGVSIALLKILDGQDLTIPQMVSEVLPIIRDSFAQPELISIEVDKKPKITLFLLNSL